MQTERFETDVLCIGGGFGGLFAAIKAREHGARDVLIVDKGAVGLTGQSKMAAGATIYLHEGDDLASWTEAIFRGQAGLCQQDMVEAFLAGSAQRLRELEAMGVVYRSGWGQKYTRLPSRGLAPIRMTLFPQYQGMTGGSALTAALRKQALRLGVEFCDKVFVSDLVVQDGRVLGAIGLHRRTGRHHVFRAGAVIVAACDCSFRGNYACVEATTGDGFAMAHRAGAELDNMEFLCCNTGPVEFNFEGTGAAGQMGARFLNARDEAFMTRYRPEGDRAELNHLVQAMAREIRSGAGPPFYFDFRGLPGAAEGAFRSMGGWMPRNLARLTECGATPFGTKPEWIANVQTLRGGIRTDARCQSNIEGLFAAGTAQSMGPGLFNGWSSGRSMWSGAMAGEIAAQYVRDADRAAPALAIERELEAGIEARPIDAARGDLSLAELTLRLQRTLFSYETSILKSEASLERARGEIATLAGEALPRVRIADLHELVRYHETQNMLRVADLFLRASLLRRETRSDHCREDFPQADPGWLKQIVFRSDLEQGHRLEPFPWQRYRLQPDVLETPAVLPS